MRLTAKDAAMAGNAVIAGFPFSTGTNPNPCAIVVAANMAAGITATPTSFMSGMLAYLYKSPPNTALTTVTASDITSTTDISGSGTVYY